MMQGRTLNVLFSYFLTYSKRIVTKRAPNINLMRIKQCLCWNMIINLVAGIEKRMFFVTSYILAVIL